MHRPRSPEYNPVFGLPASLPGDARVTLFRGQRSEKDHWLPAGDGASAADRLGDTLEHLTMKLHVPRAIEHDLHDPGPVEGCVELIV